MVHGIKDCGCTCIALLNGSEAETGYAIGRLTLASAAATYSDLF